MGPMLAYEQGLAAGRLKPDAAQAVAVARLDRLAAELAALRRPGFFERMFGTAKAPRGLYIHGPIGRGKTMAMDLFFDAADVAPKQRVHFHGFMQDVHARLHAARRNGAGVIAPVAQAIASEARLLCLDELQIGDIADAMIVGRLFEEMLAHGVVVVTTSNLAPDDLYKDGLNRQLFLPFIRLIAEKLDVVALDGGSDYRLGRVKAHETFLTPLGPGTGAKLQEVWQRLTDTEKGEPVEIDVLGRKLHVAQAAHGCARFSFAELCGKPLGPPDYLAIARNFRTVFIERIPALSPASRNEAKRFVILIDTLYDAQARLVASSAKAPEGIYPAGDHRFEFGRTVSRLREMQSAGWWGKKIAET